MTITTIRDSLRALAQSLQISTSFPAALFVIMNLYFILPVFFPIELDSAVTFSMVVSSALLISYVLYAFNFPLIRFLEGYKLRDSQLNQWLTHIQLRRFYENYQKLLWADADRQFCSNNLSFDPLERQKRYDLEPLSPADEYYWKHWVRTNYECSLLRYILEHSFPSNAKAVLATTLGNAIAAFEDYPRSRYGMDSIALWPRLLPILRTSKYHEYVTQEKMTFDFLLNMIVIIALLTIEFFYSFLYQNTLLPAIFSVVLGCGILVVLYQGLVVAARQWGTTVRVAFDTHRQELFQRLKLQSVSSTAEEYKRWQEVSAFFIYRQEEYAFSGFVPTKEVS